MPDITTPDAAVESAARALDANFNPDHYPIMAAMFRDYAWTALAAAAPYIGARTVTETREQCAKCDCDDFEEESND